MFKVYKMYRSIIIGITDIQQAVLKKVLMREVTPFLKIVSNNMLCTGTIAYLEMVVKQLSFQACKFHTHSAESIGMSDTLLILHDITNLFFFFCLPAAAELLYSLAYFSLARRIVSWTTVIIIICLKKQSKFYYSGCATHPLILLLSIFLTL